MRKKGIKYLLFDLDHTLWHCDKNSVSCLKTIYEGYDIDKYYPAFEEFVTAYRTNNETLWHRLAEEKEQGIENLTVQQIWIERFIHTLEPKGLTDTDILNQLSEEYMRLIAKSKELMPDVAVVLAELRKRYTICIATNGISATQRSKIASSQLDQYTDHLFISEDIGAMKPQREFFETIIHALGCKAEECVMIGDNPDTDIRGAQNAGIATIWYNSRKSKDNVETTTISSLLELKELL